MPVGWGDYCGFTAKDYQRPAQRRAPGRPHRDRAKQRRKKSGR